MEGVLVGIDVGNLLGEKVGVTDGVSDLLGLRVDKDVGMVRFVVGLFVNSSLGPGDGCILGSRLMPRLRVGVVDGRFDGLKLGFKLALKLGFDDGKFDGLKVGSELTLKVGTVDGPKVGSKVGLKVGVDDGKLDGL